MLNLKCLYPQSPERQGHSHSLPGPSVLLGPCLFLLVTEGPVLTSSHQTPLELPLSSHCGHCPLLGLLLGRQRKWPLLLHQVSYSPSAGLSSAFTVPFNVAIFRDLCHRFFLPPHLWEHLGQCQSTILLRSGTAKSEALVSYLQLHYGHLYMDVSKHL